MWVPLLPIYKWHVLSWSKYIEIMVVSAVRTFLQTPRLPRWSALVVTTMHYWVKGKT